MVTFQITFIDSLSKGEKLTTTYTAKDGTTEDKVINFFDLNRPDVEWYEIKKVDSLSDLD